MNLKRIRLTFLVVLIFAAFVIGLSGHAETTPQRPGIFKKCWQLLAGPREYTPTEIALHNMDESIWESIEYSARSEVLSFRKLSKDEQEKYLSKTGEEVLEKIRRKTGISRIGAHYNLHGGNRAAFYDKGGILLSMGDSGVAGGFSQDYRRKVYFYSLEKFNLAEALGDRNPQYIFKRSRMGDVLILFDIAAAEKNVARLSKGKEIDSTEIYIAAPTEAISSGNYIGVPSAAYLTLPLSVFKNFKQLSGLESLDWNEETLLAMRVVEEAVLNHATHQP